MPTEKAATIDPRASVLVRNVFACGMSRSGTTLLTTILDSHPAVSMGYELLPAGLPALDETLALLRSACDASGDDAEQCIAHIEKQGHASLATFVKRCRRTLVEPDELIGICESFKAEGQQDLNTIEMRARLSLAVVEAKRQREETSCCGYKINAPSVEAFHGVLGAAAYTYIVRDPRDVVASHFANEFDRTIEHICRAWVQYAERFLAFMTDHPDEASLVRYEDLVAQPDEALPRLLAQIGLSDCPEVREFYNSKASVHARGHANKADLQRDFFTTSIGRWQGSLTPDQIEQIQNACGHLMGRFGYQPAPTEAPAPMPPRLRDRQRKALAKKKRYYRDQYGELVLPLANGRTNLTWCEAATGAEPRNEEIFILRHDVDHDFETALDMARWEHAHQLRATYCILHTAWYYGERASGQAHRYREMLDCCLELQSLDHEINLHNNFVVLALNTGEDVRRLLEQELWFLRMHGVQIRGSSTHGDELCRKLDFRNYELFSESVYASRGGPRTVEHRGHQVQLGQVSMHEFGLDYEAYDIPRDLYVTDSGGNLRERTNTRGRAGLRRSQMQTPPPYPFIAGLLTHPVWWDLQRDAPAD